MIGECLIELREDRMIITIQFKQLISKIIKFVKVFKFVAFPQKPSDSQELDSEISYSWFINSIKRKVAEIIGPIQLLWFNKIA